MPQRPFQRMDRLELVWLDIQESPTGDTKDACLAHRTTIGYFWEYKDDQGIPCLVTTTTYDLDGTHNQGWTCYPMSVILSLRKMPNPRTRKPK